MYIAMLAHAYRALSLALLYLASAKAHETTVNVLVDPSSATHQLVVPRMRSSPRVLHFSAFD